MSNRTGGRKNQRPTQIKAFLVSISLIFTGLTPNSADAFCFEEAGDLLGLSAAALGDRQGGILLQSFRRQSECKRQLRCRPHADQLGMGENPGGRIVGFFGEPLPECESRSVDSRAVYAAIRVYLGSGRLLQRHPPG